jgi:ligand-binding sensor domain-containing protein
MLKIELYKWFIIFILLGFGCSNDDNEPENKNEPWDKKITVIKTHKNIVWIGTNGNGIYKLEEDSWLNYTSSDGLIYDEISTLLVDKNEILWVGTSKGLSKFENENWTNFTVNEGLFKNDIRSLAYDQQNNIWIGTRNNRVVKYNGTVFSSNQVNPKASGEAEMGHIHTITCDLEGNIWVGSCISGLSKFDGLNWFDFVNNLTVFVNSSICTEDGNVWIGHYTGAYNYSNGIWTKYSEINGIANHCILCIDFDQQQNIWVGTEQGISKFDGSTWTNYNVDNNSINEYVSCLACDQNGNIWLGNGSGLMKFNPGKSYSK